MSILLKGGSELPFCSRAAILPLSMQAANANYPNSREGREYSESCRNCVIRACTYAVHFARRADSDGRDGA
jgi:hypothetical protein